MCICPSCTLTLAPFNFIILTAFGIFSRRHASFHLEAVKGGGGGVGGAIRQDGVPVVACCGERERTKRASNTQGEWANQSSGESPLSISFDPAVRRLPSKDLGPMRDPSFVFFLFFGSK